MSEPIIIQKIENMIEYGHSALRQFPKAEKHVMSQEIRRCMINLMRRAVQLWRKEHKKTAIKDLDVELDILRRLVRLSVSLGFLPYKKYAIWSKYLTEIGKLVGSWSRKLFSNRDRVTG